MSPRPHISVTTKLAAALFARGDVPYDHATRMHEDQIIALYHWHHNKRASEEGGDHFSNLEPMLIAEHRERTAKIDIPQIAKNKRIQRDQQDFRRRLLAKDLGEPRVEARRSSLRSHGFDKTRTRTFSGRVVPRNKRREGNA